MRKLLYSVIMICSIIFAFKECKGEDLSRSPSEKMFKKFETISNERWLNLFTKVTSGEWLKEIKQELAVSVAPESIEAELEMAKETMDEMQEWMNSIEGDTLQEKAEKLTSKIMEQWKDAFVVSDIEAEKLLFGQYDDIKNKNDIRQCISAFADKRIAMPFPLRSFIQDFYDGKLNSSSGLEFTARLLKEHLKQISK